MRKKTISVIVPVYNVEEYLKRCLDSLVSQTLENMEIIIVNDGTPDNSQKIIDEYVDKYTFVKSFIKENGGLSDARNFGLSKASGEYIAFVDSDDYVDENMYRSMYLKAKESNFDVVVCDFEEIYAGYIRQGNSRLQTDLKSKQEIKEHMTDFYPSVWNKIYKRELMTRGIEFKKGIWFEDVEWFYRILPYISSVGVVPEPFYKYVQREGSISRSNDLRIFNHIDNWNGIVEFYRKHNLYEEFQDELEYSYVRYLYATFIKASLKMEFDSYKDAISVAQENVKRNFPSYRKNLYFYKSIKGIYLIMFNKILGYFYYFFNKLKA